MCDCEFHRHYDGLDREESRRQLRELTAGFIPGESPTPPGLLVIFEDEGTTDEAWWAEVRSYSGVHQNPRVRFYPVTGWNWDD